MSTSRSPTCAPQVIQPSMPAATWSGGISAICARMALVVL